jgi:YVTN family beta-propeller protein
MFARGVRGGLVLLLAGLPAAVRSTWTADAGARPAAPTHPSGNMVQAVEVSDRPYGVAVSAAGAVLVSRLDAASLSRLSLPGRLEPGTLAVGPVPTDVVFSPPGDIAYVANQFGHSIGVVDVASGSQVATLPVSGDPFRVVMSADGATLYATSNADRVFVFDAGLRVILRSIPVGLDPNGLAQSPDGEFLYVSGQSDGSLTKVRAATGQTVARVRVCEEPQEAVMSPDGEEIYLACGRGALEIRRAFDLGLIQRVNEATGGFGMALTPDGEQLYLTQTRLHQIAVVDRAARRVVRTIPLCGLPRRIRFSQGGEVAVVADETGVVVFIR